MYNNHGHYTGFFSITVAAWGFILTHSFTGYIHRPWLHRSWEHHRAMRRGLPDSRQAAGRNKNRRRKRCMPQICPTPGLTSPGRLRPLKFLESPTIASPAGEEPLNTQSSRGRFLSILPCTFLSESPFKLQANPFPVFTEPCVWTPRFCVS